MNSFSDLKIFGKDLNSKTKKSPTKTKNITRKTVDNTVFKDELRTSGAIGKMLRRNHFNKASRQGNLFKTVKEISPSERENDYGVCFQNMKFSD